MCSENRDKLEHFTGITALWAEQEHFRKGDGKLKFFNRTISRYEVNKCSRSVSQKEHHLKDWSRRMHRKLALFSSVWTEKSQTNWLKIWSASTATTSRESQVNYKASNKRIYFLNNIHITYWEMAGNPHQFPDQVLDLLRKTSWHKPKMYQNTWQQFNTHIWNCSSAQQYSQTLFNLKQRLQLWSCWYKQNPSKPPYLSPKFVQGKNYKRTCWPALRGECNESLLSTETPATAPLWRSCIEELTCQKHAWTPKRGAQVLPEAQRTHDIQ